MRTCDRMQSFIRPQRCGYLMAAGRYGDAQKRVQIKFERLQLFGLIWFSRSGSLRSISHAIRRPPHTSRALGRGVARAAPTPSPPDLDNSPASSACVPLLLFYAIPPMGGWGYPHHQVQHFRHSQSRNVLIYNAFSGRPVMVLHFVIFSLEPD